MAPTSEFESITLTPFCVSLTNTSLNLICSSVPNPSCVYEVNALVAETGAYGGSK